MSEYFECDIGAVRAIHNFQFDGADLKPLTNSGNKIPATTINAYCAYLQECAESDNSDPDWVIFLSWMGPIATKAIPEGAKGGVSTIEGHIKAAASTSVI